MVNRSSLSIKKSTLPGAGKGLFTSKSILRGQLIVEYKGRIRKWKDIDDVNNRYLYYINKNHVIDGNGNKKNLARYANDAKGITKIKGITNNAVYVLEGEKVFIKAMKYIPAGNEILVGYGKEYWDIIKENSLR